jgi:uncharacterized membrane protein
LQKISAQPLGAWKVARSLSQKLKDREETIRTLRNQLVDRTTGREGEAGGQIVAASMQMSHYQGPMPPPGVLRDYNDIVPGTAAKIVDQWLQQVEHRQMLERKTVLGGNGRAWCGLWIGATLGAAALGLGGFLVYTGHDTAGTSIIATALVGGVSTFIAGTLKQVKDLQDKKPK